ncbi:MAG TPA: hypothetical protein DCS30_14985 [Rhizobiales bacterium]|nr:hypothetical protein [Hyphomicrobiales bacterium]
MLLGNASVSDSCMMQTHGLSGEWVSLNVSHNTFDIGCMFFGMMFAIFQSGFFSIRAAACPK